MGKGGERTRRDCVSFDETDSSNGKKEDAPSVRKRSFALLLLLLRGVWVVGHCVLAKKGVGGVECGWRRGRRFELNPAEQLSESSASAGSLRVRASKAAKSLREKTKSRPREKRGDVCLCERGRGKQDGSEEQPASSSRKTKDEGRRKAASIVIELLEKAMRLEGSEIRVDMLSEGPRKLKTRVAGETGRR